MAFLFCIVFGLHYLCKDKHVITNDRREKVRLNLEDKLTVGLAEAEDRPVPGSLLGVTEIHCR